MSIFIISIIFIRIWFFVVNLRINKLFLLIQRFLKSLSSHWINWLLKLVLLIYFSCNELIWWCVFKQWIILNYNHFIVTRWMTYNHNIFLRGSVIIIIVHIFLLLATKSYYKTYTETKNAATYCQANKRSSWRSLWNYNCASSVISSWSINIHISCSSRGIHINISSCWSVWISCRPIYTQIKLCL